MGIESYVPKEFLKSLAAITTTSVLNEDTGEYENTTTSTSFTGAILPISNREMSVLPQGSYQITDKKLYTDQVFLSNTKIQDGTETYTIYAPKEYGIVNPNFKTYYMKLGGAING